MSTKGFEEEVIQVAPAPPTEEELRELRKKERRFQKETPRRFRLDQRTYGGHNEHKWFVEIPRGEMTLLGAPGGTGKSWMFLYWAHYVANHTNPDTGKPWRVMLWLGEDAAPMTYDRLCQLDENYKSMEEPPENVEFIWDQGKPLYQAERYSIDKGEGSERRRITASKVSTTEEMDKLEKRIAAFKPDILFLDPLSVLGPMGFETDNEVCAKFVSEMRDLFRKFDKLTVVVSHHSNKAGKSGDDASSLRGSSALIDGFRHAFTLRVFYRDQKNGEDILFLRTVKANYLAPVNTFYKRTIANDKTTIAVMTREEIDAMFEPEDVRKALGEDAKIEPKGKDAGAKGKNAKLEPNGKDKKKAITTIADDEEIG